MPQEVCSGRLPYFGGAPLQVLWRCTPSLSLCCKGRREGIAYINIWKVRTQAVCGRRSLRQWACAAAKERLLLVDMFQSNHFCVVHVWRGLSISAATMVAAAASAASNIYYGAAMHLLVRPSENAAPLFAVSFI